MARARWLWLPYRRGAGCQPNSHLLTSPRRMTSGVAPRVTVLMTSFNRREQTLACLRTLYNSEGPAALRCILVDDGSADGTAEAVRSAFPEVTILEGTGALYWAGGMRLAFDHAWNAPFDYLLWLNDDVMLARGALHRLIQTERRLHPVRGACIVVGALQDPITGVTTYSGVLRRGLRRTHFRRIAPGAEPRRAETMNGNVVLVARHVAECLGTFDPAYPHGIADYDYGLRGAAAGIETWIAPRFVGTCAWNGPDVPGNWRARLIHTASRKRLPPSAWMVFTRRHAGPMWPLYWASPYARALLPRRNVAGRRQRRVVPDTRPEAKTP